MYGIIVGSGRLGSALALSLADEGHDVVVVDRSSEALSRLGSGFNGRTVLGTGIDKDVLRRAGVDQADFVCAVTSDDLVNLMVVQLAKQVFRVERVIARIFDPKRAELYEDLGVHTISSVDMGVREVKDVLRLDGFSKVMTLDAGSLELVSFTVAGALSGKAVQDVDIPRKLKVVTVMRGGVKTLASREDVLNQGDIVCVAVRIDAMDVIRSMVKGSPSGKRGNGGFLGL